MNRICVKCRKPFAAMKGVDVCTCGMDIETLSGVSFSYQRCEFYNDKDESLDLNVMDVVNFLLSELDKKERDMLKRVDKAMREKMHEMLLDQQTHKELCAAIRKEFNLDGGE